MDSSEIESLEEKLKNLLAQLQTEFGVFERIVYKNKNQHRRSSYFQYLLKVRRDLRLLQSTKLEELLSSCFQVITGKRPKQKLHLLESLKRRKCDGGKYNFIERLLGAARLLSQMVEPMLKAAIEVYREFYPANQGYMTLECLWSTDKFILLEKSHMSDVNSQEGDSGSKIPVEDSAVRYQSLEAFLGDDEPDSEKANNNAAAEHPTTNTDDNKINLLASPSDDRKQVDSTLKIRDDSGTSETPYHESTPEGGLLASSHSSPTSNPFTVKSSKKKVAFVSVSVKRPAPSTSNSLDLNMKEIEKKSDEPEDKFYNLLTGGSLKDSLF